MYSSGRRRTLHLFSRHPVLPGQQRLHEVGRAGCRRRGDALGLAARDGQRTLPTVADAAPEIIFVAPGPIELVQAKIPSLFFCFAKAVAA